jgi:hypothetical protein
VRIGGGATVPGLGVRQNLKDGPGEGFYYRGGIEDPTVWNHFETEGRFSNDLESMDIHTWCSIPEAGLARQCYFYMDDVSLEVIEEPALVISTPLDEFYAGESIAWTATAASTNGEIKIALFDGDRLVGEQTHPAASGLLRGAFESRGLKPGLYTLQARISAPPHQAPPTARQQVIVTSDPFAWSRERQ